CRFWPHSRNPRGIPFMPRPLALLTLLPALLVFGAAGAADDEEASTTKEALQALNEFIGDWRGSGPPEKVRPEPRETWQETVSWSWRFKGDDASLVMNVKNGKHVKGGELRYLPAKKRYQFTAADKDGQKLVYEGQLKGGYLTLERKDPATKELQQL